MKFDVIAAARLALALLFLSVAAPGMAQDKPAEPAASLSNSLTQVQTFLRQQLGNDTIALKPKGAEVTEVLAGGKPAGTLTFKDDTYEWTLKLSLSEFTEGGTVDLKKAEPYLKALLGGRKIGVQAKSDSSAEVTLSVDIDSTLIVDRAAGTVSIESFFFSDDLPRLAGPANSGASKALVAAAGAIEPVDAANSMFYARMNGVKIFDEPDSSGAPSVTLTEGHKVKVTGKIRNPTGDDLYRVDLADGKPHFVAADDLLNEDGQERRQRYKVLVNNFPMQVGQTAASSGALAPFMGFYTLGAECSYAPMQVKRIEGFEKAYRTSQDVQDLFWSKTSAALWSDGTHMFRAHVDSGKPDRFKPSFIRKVKFAAHGEVQIWRMERVEPPGFDPDLSVVGFTENGKILLSVEIDDNSYKWPRVATRCSSVSVSKEATASYYKVWLARLAGQVLPGPKAAGDGKPQRVDPAANGKFFVRLPDVVLRATPEESGKEVAKLKENEEIKLISVQSAGSTLNWNEARWWQIETKAGDVGHVLGKNLMSEDAFKTKGKLVRNVGALDAVLSKPPSARGPNVRLAGIFSLTACQFQKAPPKQKTSSPLVENVTNRLQLTDNKLWLADFEFLWFEGDFLYRTDLTDPTVVRKYRMAQFRTEKYNGTTSDRGDKFKAYVGQVRFFKLTHLDGPKDDNADWETIGINEGRHLLKAVRFEGTAVKFKFRPRCEGLVLDIQQAANETYLQNIHLMPMADQPIKFLAE